MKRIQAKLGKMRKPQEFIVYPKQEGSNRVVIQSDKAIAAFNPDTGKGLLNIKGCYFVHLNHLAGAIDYQFPKDFIEACIEARPQSGDLIGYSRITGPVYVA